jgi:hypothetical protein
MFNIKTFWYAQNSSWSCHLVKKITNDMTIFAITLAQSWPKQLSVTKIANPD